MMAHHKDDDVLEHVTIHVLLDHTHHTNTNNNVNDMNHIINNTATSELASETERLLTPTPPSNIRNGSHDGREGDCVIKLSIDSDDGGDEDFVDATKSGPRSSMQGNGYKQKRSAVAECRICQEEDEHTNLESPCACSGSLKFAHRKCVQHWCDEKGDTICEICLQPYNGGYTAPTTNSASQLNFPINIGDTWEIARGQQINMHEPRLFTVASEHLFSESEYGEYARANEQSAACFRFVALVLLVVLVLRHVLTMISSGDNDDRREEQESSTFFLLFFLRAVGFFLPCYIMGRALNMIQGRRQRQSLVASEVAYILQTGIQGQEIHIAMSRGISP